MLRKQASINKTMILDHYLIPHTHKLIKVNERPETKKKVLEENTDDKLLDTGLGDDFWT